MSLRHSRWPRAARVACVARVAIAVLAAACRDDVPTGADGPRAPVTVSAAFHGTEVEALSIHVTGPAIATPIVVNVEVPAHAGTVTATLVVPVGGQRTFLVRGYDGTGEVTHEGMATVAVRPAANPPLAIRIYPRTGDVPIGVGVGTFAVTITPAPLDDAVVGDARQLRATVTDESGALVPNATVTWGSLNPRVAHVAAAGLVTALAEGTTTIHASYQGAAASVDLAVTPLQFRDVFVGSAATCAIDTRFAAWCWGEATSSGNFGNPQWSSEPGQSADVATRPVPVAGGHRFGSLAMGRTHVCGVTLGGEAWCWGSGQLGVGQTNLGSPIRIPTRVLGGLTFRSLAANWGGTCGIAESTSEAWCWGLGVPGYLGSAGPGAQLVNMAAPTRVTSASGPWLGLSLSSGVACGVRPAGEAVCPADGDSPVSTASAAGYGWRTLQVDGVWRDPATYILERTTPFACGLTNQDEVRCWGHGSVGQLGTGTGLTTATQPMLVAGPQGYGALAVGNDFACGLRSGTAWCWGLNDFGQLGDGTTDDRDVPMPVLGGHTFTRISAGEWHACAIRTDGALLCWGGNVYGELGDGSRTHRGTPARAATRIAVPLPVTP